jgi:hypothetical protein
MPTDSPLLRVLAELEADGYRAQFVPLDGGVVRCTRGGHVFSASSGQPDGSRRLEGVSDPADMMIVFSLRCPVCATAGTLVLHYGPEASVEEAEVLVAMEPPARDASGRAGNDAETR